MSNKYKISFDIKNPNNYECNLYISLQDKPILFNANETKSLVYYLNVDNVGIKANFRPTNPKILASEDVVILAQYTRVLLETNDGQLFETSDGQTIQLKE